ncbi:MAG: hypothetical protein ACR2NF_04750 [Pirellulales bacterium]
MNAQDSNEMPPHLLWQESSGEILSGIEREVSEVEDAISELRDRIKQKENHLDALKSSLEAVRELNSFVDDRDVAENLFSVLIQRVYGKAKDDGRSELEALERQLRDQLAREQPVKERLLEKQLSQQVRLNNELADELRRLQNQNRNRGKVNWGETEIPDWTR